MKRCIPSAVILVLTLGMYACTLDPEQGKIPITTSSEKAKEEFLKGRSLAEKLMLTNSNSHFDEAIALDSSFALAYLNRSNTSLTTKEAFFYLSKAIALQDKCSEGERLMIQSVEAATNGNTTKQKEALDKLAVLFPDDERVWFNLGNYYFAQQKFEKAIEAYQKAVDLAPDYSSAYNSLGYSYRQVEKYQDAENAFKKYIDLIPGDPNPYDSYGELLLVMGRFNESIANYEKALKADSYFIASHIGLAANYMYKGDTEKGTAQLNKFFPRARNDGERRQIFLTQIILYTDAGKTDLALQELEKLYALDDEKNDIAAQSADYAIKGTLLAEKGKFSEALAAFEKSALLVGTSGLSQELKDNAQSLLHYNRASIALDKADMKTAAAETETFRKATLVNNNTNQIWLAHELAGRIALTEGNTNLAIDEFQQANLQNPYTLYRLALAHQAKGAKVKAKLLCKKAAQFYGLPLLNYALVRAKAEKLLLTL